MKNLVLLSICFLLVVEGVLSLQKSTRRDNSHAFQPLTLSKDIKGLRSGVVSKRNLAKTEPSYTRQIGSLYQPLLTATSTIDENSVYDWCTNKDYIFGETEDAGIVPISEDTPLTKYDSFEPEPGQPGVYRLLIVFFTDGRDMLPDNFYDLDVLLISTGVFEPLGGPSLELPLPFDNAYVVEDGVFFAAFSGETYLGALAGEATLNEEGSALAKCSGGAAGVVNSQVSEVQLHIFIANPAEAGTDAPSETFATGDLSGETVNTDATLETFDDTDLTKDTEETKETKQTTDETEDTNESQETDDTQPSGSQPSVTQATSSTTPTPTGDTASTQTQTQGGTTAPAASSSSTQEDTSSAVSLCASFLAIVGALVQLL